MTESQSQNPRPQATVGSLVGESLAEVTSLDRGLFWTFAMLWRDPRRVIDGALAMDPKVTRPLRFLLIVLAATAIAVLYPLVLAAKLLAGRAPMPVTLAPLGVASLWWPWFTQSVYRSGWGANLFRAALVPGLTLIGAFLVLMLLLCVTLGLALVL